MLQLISVYFEHVINAMSQSIVPFSIFKIFFPFTSLTLGSVCKQEPMHHTINNGTFDHVFYNLLCTL